MAAAVDVDLASGDSYINILIAGFFITWLGTCLYTSQSSKKYLSFSDFENPPFFFLVVD